MPEGNLKKSSEDPVAAEIREAIGAGPDEPVTVIGPQFERARGATTPAPPPTDWEALRGMSRVALRELGCRTWNDPTEPDDEFDGLCLMLFPWEWYSSIPVGFVVTTINNKDRTFAPGDDDQRAGCLSYGVKVKP